LWPAEPSLLLPAPDPVTFREQLLLVYKELFEQGLGFEVEWVQVKSPADSGLSALRLAGPFALALAEAESGTHVAIDDDGRLILLQVLALPLPPEQCVQSAVEDFANRREIWLRAAADGQATIEADPMPLLPVRRVYEQSGTTIDLRTSLAIDGWPNADELRRMLLSGLPLPSELMDGQASCLP
jgi:hypothetical protein